MCILMCRRKLVSLSINTSIFAFSCTFMYRCISVYKLIYIYTF